MSFDCSCIVLVNFAIYYRGLGLVAAMVVFDLFYYRISMNLTCQKIINIHLGYIKLFKYVCVTRASLLVILK
jgi:hypothetical protein